jgi:hypothetical protein
LPQLKGKGAIPAKFPAKVNVIKSIASQQRNSDIDDIFSEIPSTKSKPIVPTAKTVTPILKQPMPQKQNDRKQNGL